MNRLCYRLLSLLLPWVFLSGCVGPQTRLYPDFPGRKASYARVRVYLDVLVNDYQGEETFSLDLPENRELVASSAEAVRDRLREKGYAAEGPVIQSVGLGLGKGDSNPRWLISSPEDREKKLDELPSAPPPYFLDDLLAGDEPLKTRLAGLYPALDRYVKTEEGPNTVLPDAGGLGEGVDGIVLLTVRGCDAGFGVRVRESFKTLGKDLVKYSSQVTLDMLVVDPRTGEVVWSQGLKFHQDRMKPADVLRCVEFLLKCVP